MAFTISFCFFFWGRMLICLGIHAGEEGSGEGWVPRSPFQLGLHLAGKWGSLLREWSSQHLLEDWEAFPWTPSLRWRWYVYNTLTSQRFFSFFVCSSSHLELVKFYTASDKPIEIMYRRFFVLWCLEPFIFLSHKIYDMGKVTWKISSCSSPSYGTLAILTKDQVMLIYLEILLFFWRKNCFKNSLVEIRDNDPYSNLMDVVV